MVARAISATAQVARHRRFTVYDQLELTASEIDNQLQD